MKNDIRTELGTNFIEYAVAVNTDRAIPDSKSGLKPVAKRILWGAYQGGYKSNKAHVKSAKIVGDVMGTYHPHGDSSIYEAMVRLSRPWVMRYPLIDWHGNNGNITGDGAAHMRYTEARLAKLSEEGLLSGIKKENVDFIPNYDETTQEPVTLPAIFPNLLCNPNEGIGVAMACKWAPHNLIEVAKAINDYLEGKEPMLPGPDFPTGGIVINKDDIPSIMRTGHGSVKVRAKYTVEGQKIIFTEVPYATTIEGLVAQIGEICEKKEIEGISDAHDESNKKGVRIVVTCDKGINPDAIVSKLFSKTDLQSSFSYNQVALVGKTPTELNLKQCIEIYVNHNIDCLLKEMEFDKRAAETRKEIVEGLLKALEDIDNIITLIKGSDNSAAAKENLIKKYAFTEPQAKSILAMRLSSLAKLEKVELNNELAELVSQLQFITEVLTNKDKQIAIIRERLDKIVKTYGDARRTELTQIDIKPKEKEKIEIIPEDVVVIVSQSGDIKRVPKNSFKTQRRNGKGVKTVDGAIMATISTNTIDTLMIFTDKGRMFRLSVDKVPVGTNAAKGTRLGSLIKMDIDEHVAAVSSLEDCGSYKYVVFFTKGGLIKKTLFEEFSSTKKTTGIQAIKFKEGDSLANVGFLNDEEVLIITKNGMSIHFPTKEINSTGRASAGVKSIGLSEGDEVIQGIVLNKSITEVFVIAENGMGKRVNVSEFSIQNRGGKGLVCYRGSKLVGVAPAADTDILLVIGKLSSICIEAKDVSVSSRETQGVKITRGSNPISVVRL